MFIVLNYLPLLQLEFMIKQIKRINFIFIYFLFPIVLETISILFCAG